MESGRKQLRKKIKIITEGNVKPEFSLTGQKNSLTLFLPAGEINVIPTCCVGSNRARHIFVGIDWFIELHWTVL